MPAKPPPSPAAILSRAGDLFRIRRILVGVSCGKDATATLDLCCQHFGPENVVAYFQYLVPDLSFQSSYLAYLERRYSPLEIIRLPHWLLSSLYRSSTFREPTAASAACSPVRIRDVSAYLLKLTGIRWMATGEKACDSVERNAQIRHCDAIDPKRRRIYPIAYLSDGAVFSYLRSRHIALPPEYGSLGLSRSFGSLWYREIAPIREKAPADYAKLLRHFPMLETQIVRYEMRAERQAVREKESAKESAKESEKTAAAAT